MWKLLDHTADLAIEGSGASGEEALTGLCEGLTAQLTEPEKVRVTGTRRFSAKGVDLEDAIVTAVGELLFAKKDDTAWWECTNAAGASGLLPSNYVEDV